MRTFPLLACCFLLGCPEPTPTDEPTPTPTGVDETPRTDVTVQVTDEAGGAIEGAQIRFCRGDLCLNGSTDAAGAHAFEQVVAEPTSLEVLGPDGSSYAVAFSAVTLEEDVPRTFEVTMLALDTASPLTDTADWHTVGAGLRIQAAASDLEPPPFIDAATEVAGVAVPVASHPPLDGLTDVQGVWFLDPFDHHSTAGLPVEIDHAATDGDVYRVYVGDYASSTWIDAGTLTATGGVLTGDARLPLLSTVVLSGPETL